MSLFERSGPVIANIGPRGQQRRRMLGFVSLAAGLLLIIMLNQVDTAPGWGLIAFLPFWGSALGVLEARERTCVALAARGSRDLDDGEMPVVHSAEREKLRQQARRIQAAAVVVGVVAGILTILVA
jgi:hypothetical protein